MKSAAIAGAGIGGLAAALALRQIGWHVRVFERAASPRDLGFALLLAPNAIASLRALGMADEVVAAGIRGSRGFMRRSDGRLLRTLDIRDVEAVVDEPTVMVLRQALHGALLAAVGEECLVLGHAVLGVGTDDDAASLVLEDGTTVAADLVVGADGAGSVIRHALHPHEPPPRPGGLWALRGVAYGVVGRLDGFSGGQYFGRGIEAGLAQASADAVYWYLSIPERLVEEEMPDARAVRQRAMASFPATLRAILMATRDEDMRLDRLFDRAPLDSWGRGRVTLLGDAAHPMLPHAGQGAAQALEDAVALGRILSVSDGVVSGLRRYERVRGPRTRQIVDLARRNARLGSVTHPVLCRLRDAAIRLTPKSILLKSLIAVGRPPAIE